MPDLQLLLRPPYIYLTAGVTLLFLGVFSTCTGKASSRFRWIYRAKEPSEFWWAVTIYYFGGALFIGYFLYKVYQLGN
jgi:hypothetical protein